MIAIKTNPRMIPWIPPAASQAVPEQHPELGASALLPPTRQRRMTRIPAAALLEPEKPTWAVSTSAVPENPVQVSAARAAVGSGAAPESGRAGESSDAFPRSTAGASPALVVGQ